MSFQYGGIDHVQLAAPEGCEEEARLFFGGILLWQEIPKPASLQHRGGVWFQCGAHQVHIGVQESFVPARKAHPAFSVKGLALLNRRLREQGLTLAEDELRVEEGYRRFFVNDPFGNRLEFMERTGVDNVEQ